MELLLYTTFFYTFSYSSLFCFILDVFANHCRVNTQQLTYEIVLSDYRKMTPLVLFNLLTSYSYFYIFHRYCLDYQSNTLHPIVNFILWIITTDVLFYTIHKAFHHKYLYSFHSIHHEFRYTYGMGAIYAHPLEFYLANLLPVSLPMVLYGIPIWLCNYIVLFATAYTVIISHGGYKLHLATSHLHHHLKYKCNYGLLKFDMLMGTKCF